MIINILENKTFSTSIKDTRLLLSIMKYMIITTSQKIIAISLLVNNITPPEKFNNLNRPPQDAAAYAQFHITM
jgi:hypothetical protein